MTKAEYDRLRAQLLRELRRRLTRRTRRKPRKPSPAPGK